MALKSYFLAARYALLFYFQPLWPSYPPLLLNACLGCTWLAGAHCQAQICSSDLTFFVVY